MSLLVNHTQGAPAGGANFTTTAIDTTGSTFLYVAIGSYMPGSSADRSLTDSKGNTWTQVTKHDRSSMRMQAWWCKDPTVGTGHTFTIGGAGSAPSPSIAILGFDDVLATSPADQHAGGGNGINTTKQLSVTPTQSNELALFPIGFDPAWPAPRTIDSGYTVACFLDRGANYYGIACGYKVLSSTATTSPAWGGAGSPAWVGLLDTFKLTAAAGGGARSQLIIF